MQNQLINNTQYHCQIDLNLYDSPQCNRLATQAVAGRKLRLLDFPPNLNIIDGEMLTGIPVELCEDNYPGWLALEDYQKLEIAPELYQPQCLSPEEIDAKIPHILTFTQKAMEHPNQYLWGGTIGPDYDCSGLIQTAFAASGVWLPRDAYQQEAFTQAIAVDPDDLELGKLRPGDLIFFGTVAKATHVGLYLGNGYYIHSSGKEQGRNGIGIDILSAEGDKISQTYYQQLRQGGRVIASYGAQRNTDKV